MGDDTIVTGDMIDTIDTERVVRAGWYDRQDALWERFEAAAGEVNAAHTHLVGVLCELDDTGLWSGDGVRSLTHFVMWKAGVSAQRAAQLVALVEHRDTHPVIVGAFTDGLFTLDQAATAIRTPPYRDREIRELCAEMTVGDGDHPP